MHLLNGSGAFKKRQSDESNVQQLTGRDWRSALLQASAQVQVISSHSAPSYTGEIFQTNPLHITHSLVIVLHRHQCNASSPHHRIHSVQWHLLGNCCTSAGLDVVGEKSRNCKQLCDNIQLLATFAPCLLFVPLNSAAMFAPFCFTYYVLQTYLVSSLERKNVYLN